MKLETTVPAGRYMLCDVDSLPEMAGKSVVNYTVPSGVFYDEDYGVEVMVGDYDTEGTFGRIGLIPADVALEIGYDIEDCEVEFDSPKVCYFDLSNGSFAFGDLVFTPCYSEE